MRLLQRTSQRNRQYNPMSARWRSGTPPEDGQKYDMRFRVKNAGGQWTTCWLATPGWWNGRAFVERNQITGGTRVIIPAPNQWRPETATDCRKAED